MLCKSVNNNVKTKAPERVNSQTAQARSSQSKLTSGPPQRAGRCYPLLLVGSTALLLLFAAFGPRGARVGAMAQSKPQATPPVVVSFLKQNCFACHTGKTP